jgi:acetyl-CoA carboxylase biotin carboxylase subunit
VRVDSHVYSGYTVPPFYDSLIAKIIVHQETREAAIACMRRALEEYRIEGIHTTIPLAREILRHVHFVRGKVDTGFIEEYFMG